MYVDGVHFATKDGGPKSFPFKWKHWFLVSERAELSKNVYIYNSPKNMNENTSSNPDYNCYPVFQSN